jgi:flagellar hook assembly protein FlgD
MYQKKLSQISLLMVLILCSSMAGALLINPAFADVERVVNGGFETGDLTGWTVEFPPQFDGEVTSTTSHSGTYCLRLGEVDFIHQAFTPPVSTTGDLSFWAKCDVGATLNPLGVIVYYSDESSTSQGFWPTVGAWSQYTLPVDHAKLVSKIQFATWEMQFPPPIYYYIDDVSLLGPSAVPPIVKSFTILPNPFSPNGDLVKDTTTIKAAFNVVVKWNLRVRTLAGVVVRSWAGSGNSVTVVWNGRNSAGVKVADGTYNVRLSGADLFGTSFTTQTKQVTVDTKPPAVTGVSVVPTSFNPKLGQTTKLSYTLSESCYVTIKIYNSAGTLKRTLLNNVLQTAGAHNVIWNGKDGSGNIVPPGTYSIKIWVVDKAGNKAAPYPITKTVKVL